MKEQLLKRKLNPFLLITTVLVLAILAGSSVFYQTELGDLVSTRNDLQNELENKTEILDTTLERNEELNNTVEELERSIREKNSEINSKDERISVLERELTRAENQNQETENQLSELNSTVQELNTTVRDLEFSMQIICNSNETSSTAEDRCEIHGY